LALKVEFLNFVNRDQNIFILFNVVELSTIRYRADYRSILSGLDVVWSEKWRACLSKKHLNGAFVLIYLCI
jgi:hypothetical protein